jgi:mRNA interferase RelE/StbE
MGKYRIEIKKSAIKELNTIPRKDLKKIVLKISSLSDDPRPKGCVKLSGMERYRIRQGNYRILYSIDDEILVVYVVKIRHRKEVYR